MKILASNLDSIELLWRAANYLTVGMLYLKDNPLLRDELQTRHFKRTILGHWGACPGINAIYAHACDLSRRTGQRMRLIVGTGHAGPAILANLYLEGSLGRIYPTFTRDFAGLVNLFKAFGSADGFDTEISSDYPGMLCSGGELGAALAFCQGYALRNANSFSICVIGDGELETSVTQAAWQGFRFLSSARDGRILPVINANGYKMGSKSLYALVSRDEHEKLYRGHGLFPIFVGTNREQIAEAFDAAYMLLTESNTTLQPIIILESPKGWTAPERFGNRPFRGSCNSHKPILKNPSNDINELEMIKAWLMSYGPNELFDAMGSPIREITDCLPATENLFGLSHQIDPGRPMLIQEPALHSSSSIETVSTFLESRIEEAEDIVVFSPDELASNKLGNLLEITRLKHGSLDDSVYSTNGQVVEILNEHLCYAWAHGYSMAGHHAFIISYEAFAPLFESIAAQHLKFLRACTDVAWRPACPSVNVILTSLGWKNSPTHHNPGFVDSLIGRNLDQVRIYMPVTPEATASFLKEMMQSHNRLNIMVITKHKLTRVSSMFSGAKRTNCHSWRELESDPIGDPRISLIAVGDCMAEESLFAKDIINSRYPDLFVRVLAVEDLSFLENSKHPDVETLRSTIADSSSCVWAYNGYPKTIKALLWDLGITANTKVLGYKDYDHASAGTDRFSKNEVSRFHIANEAVRLLFPNRNCPL